MGQASGPRISPADGPNPWGLGEVAAEFKRPGFMSCSHKPLPSNSTTHRMKQALPAGHGHGHGHGSKRGHRPAWRCPEGRARGTGRGGWVSWKPVGL